MKFETPPANANAKAKPTKAQTATEKKEAKAKKKEAKEKAKPGNSILSSANFNRKPAGGAGSGRVSPAGSGSGRDSPAPVAGTAQAKRGGLQSVFEGLSSVSWPTFALSHTLALDLF